MSALHPHPITRRPPPHPVFVGNRERRGSRVIVSVVVVMTTQREVSARGGRLVTPVSGARTVTRTNTGRRGGRRWKRSQPAARGQRHRQAIASPAY